MSSEVTPLDCIPIGLKAYRVVQLERQTMLVCQHQIQQIADTASDSDGVAPERIHAVFTLLVRCLTGNPPDLTDNYILLWRSKALHRLVFEEFGRQSKLVAAALATSSVANLVVGIHDAPYRAFTLLRNLPAAECMLSLHGAPRVYELAIGGEIYPLGLLDAEQMAALHTWGTRIVAAFRDSKPLAPEDVDPCRPLLLLLTAGDTQFSSSAWERLRHAVRAEHIECAASEATRQALRHALGPELWRGNA